MNLQKLDGQYIVVDIEFMNGKEGTETIELAAKRIFSFDCGQEFKEGNCFRKLIKPQQKPSKELLTFTGITEEMLESADNFKVVFKEFKRWVESEATMDTTLFISWGNRDETVLRKDCRSYGISKDFEEMTFVDFQQYIMATDCIAKLPSLQKIVEEEFGKFRGTEHHAKDDAINTAMLLQKRLEKMK